MPLEIREIDRQDDALVVAIEGRLDGSTVEAFTERIDELATPEIRVALIDCAAVTMISSHGLGALLALHKRLQARGGEAIIVGAQGVPAMILYLARLDRVFRRYSSVQEAIADMNAP